MMGIDKVIAGIIASAEEQSSIIKAEAEEKAAAICASFNTKAAEQAQVIKAESDKKCAAFLAREQAAGRQERRLAILSAQGKEIESAIEGAREKLINLPVDEYFDVLFRLFEKYRASGEGEISLGKVDATRVPNDFVNRCETAFPDCKLTLVEPTQSSDYGFIVDYGKILVNCTVDEIFRVKKQAMSDEVSKIFAEG